MRLYEKIRDIDMRYVVSICDMRFKYHRLTAEGSSEAHSVLGYEVLSGLQVTAVALRFSTFFLHLRPRPTPARGAYPT
jgi:hypothetical protein